MQIAKQITTGVVAVFMFLCMSRPMQAQGTDPIAAIQQKLTEHFVPAKLAGNGDILTAGSVLILQKDGMIMCATNSPQPIENTYNKGKLSAGMFSWGIALGLTGVNTNTIPQRKYVSGEKFWFVADSVDKNGVHFKLWTDLDSNNLRYYAFLKFPFAKNQIPPADDVMKTIAEVIMVQPDDNAQQMPDQGGPMAAVAGEYRFEMTGTHYVLLPNGSCSIRNPGGTQTPCQFIVDGDWIRLTMKIGGANFPVGNFKMQEGKLYLNGAIAPNAELIRQGVPPASAPEAAQPPPPEPAMAPIAPPPPPPAAPKTIALGQTKDEVAAILGQPTKIANLGSKEIDYYSDMKVVFTNGKVTDIQ